ncbi:MAG: tRNA pseudouridine(55) synthase TruB [Nitrospinaceae bacterium]
MTSTWNKIVNLHKPPGPTSFDLVRRVKTRLNAKKAGHIGTLDPMAEGVLPVAINGATRVIQFLTHLPKTYQAEMRLGAVTDTQDETGRVLETKSAEAVTENQAKDVLQAIVGEQAQIPPMYSAKKKNGIPLYKLARNGITVKREPVSIHIYAISFLGMEGDRVRFQVKCSAGTYVRTLCHDMGARLGCGAHMSRLVRVQVGPFGLESALTPEALDAAWAEGSLAGKLLETDQALHFLPEIRVKPEGVAPIAHGRAIPKASLESVPETFEPGISVRVTHPGGGLLAIAEPVTDAEGFARLAPRDVAFKLKRVLIEP